MNKETRKQELESLIKKNKEMKGEASAQLDSFSAKAISFGINL